MHKRQDSIASNIDVSENAQQQEERDEKDRPLHRSLDLASKYELELDYRRATYGEDHPNVAETYSILGLVYHHMYGRKADSLRCHRRALVVFRHARRHVDVAVTLTDIADIRWGAGEYAEAIKIYADALEEYRHGRLGQNHPRAHSIFRRVDSLGGCPDRGMGFSSSFSAAVTA